MESFLNQQARVNAEIHRLDKDSAELHEAHAKTEKSILRLAALIRDGFGITLKRFEKVDTEIASTEEHLRKIEAQVNRLTGDRRNGLKK